MLMFTRYFNTRTGGVDANQVQPKLTFTSQEFSTSETYLQTPLLERNEVFAPKQDISNKNNDHTILNIYIKTDTN